MSDSGLRGLRTCALAVPITALLAVIGLGADNGAAQPGGTYCDAVYCYVQTCERRPAPAPTCRYVTERVCRPLVRQECTTRSVRKCSTITDQACEYRSVSECKSVNKWVCRPAYGRVAEAQEEPDGAQQVGYQPQKKRRWRLRTVRRPYYPYRQAAPQRQPQQLQPQQRPLNPIGTKPGGYPPYGSNQPTQRCSWQMQRVCGPVAKQECRPISRQVCSDYPEQSCYPRQVQDCHEERRQVCDPAQPPQEECRRRQVQRPCASPQYWTPRGCVSPTYAPAPPPPKNTPPPTEYAKQLPKEHGGTPPTSYTKPNVQKGPDTAKLDPLPYELPNSPAPTPPNTVEPPAPAAPSEPRKESGTPPPPRPEPTVDINLNGRTWRIELDPVPIATGAGLALLLALLALWPKRKEVPADSDQLYRLGIQCRGEPDPGGQAVTHLARSPVGPRITVRATPGSRRYGIVMH